MKIPSYPGNASRFFPDLGFMYLSEKLTPPRIAYNLWAEQYDDQPDNLMLALEQEIFTRLLRDLSLNKKSVTDIGCGTGRHWKQLMEQHPTRVIGFDISEGMLNQLKKNYPLSETYLIPGDHFEGLKENHLCNVIISTLTIAHIRKIKKAFNEWNRILKPGGEIIITDYHPSALKKGADRTFLYQDKLIAVKNYVHSLEKITRIANQLHWRIKTFIEQVIDEEVKYYYKRRNALPLYEKFRGVPIIYGMHLRKDGPIA